MAMTNCRWEQTMSETVRFTYQWRIVDMPHDTRSIGIQKGASHARHSMKMPAGIPASSYGAAPHCDRSGIQLVG
jgi:hypothetical protein